MGKSRYLILVAVLAVISILGGFVGSKLDKKLDSIAKEPARKADSIVERGTEKPEGSILAERYNFGIVFPAGSAAHPSTHGIGVFETKPGLAGQERYILLQLEDAPELDKSILTVSIDGIKVGSFSINAKGFGSMSIEVKEGEAFPTVRDGSILEIKAADNSIVASGSFGAH